MPLESCVLILDDSEWMRNGDFLPTRLASQTDAAYQLATLKLEDNSESSVGVMTMTGGGKVLVSLTRDMGDILTATNGLQPHGTADVISALAIAQLVLKNRRNKHGSQRIILFVGSPLEAKERDLVRVARQLKRDGIAVDVINFGEEVENQVKLHAFIEAVKKASRPCHLVTIPSGSSTDLSALLISTPIFSLGDGSTPSSGSGGSRGASVGGVNQADDPELYEAIRASLSEAPAAEGAAVVGGEAVADDLVGLGDMDDPALQEALLLSQQLNEAPQAPATPATPTTAAPTAEATPAPAPVEDDVLEDEPDEEELLQMAMMMSQEIPSATTAPAPTSAPASTPTPAPAPTPAPTVTDDFQDDLLPEELDPELMAAIQMSLHEATPQRTPDAAPSPSPAPAPAPAPAPSTTPTATPPAQCVDDEEPVQVDPALHDALDSVLDEIEGVDRNDPEILAALKEIMGKKDDDDKSKP